MSTSMLSQALAVVLRGVLNAALALGLFWLLFAGTWRWRNDAYWQHFPPSFGCNDSQIVDKCEGEALLWFVVLPAVASLAAVCVLALPTQRQQKRMQQPQASSMMQRLAGFQLPPRRFWAWWCGGMTGADAAVVAVWLAINVSWLSAVLGRYQQLMPILRKLTSMPSWQLEWELVSTAMGSLLFPNLILLFYPISRGSVVLQATGLAFPDAIRYHRWVGHVTMVYVTAHSLGFWGIWALQGVWLQEAFSNGARVSNLFGGISFIGALALWITSLEAARRANYGVFYAMHHIGFWAFMTFGIMHYQQQLVYFLPCLLLYAVDAAYRVHQALFDRSAKVLHSAVAYESGQALLCALTIHTPHFGVSPTGFVWLHVPGIHAMQWHPFEYTAVALPDGSPAVQLYIKAYDRWTRRFVGLVAEKGQAVRLRVEGPYAELPHSHQRHQHDALVIVAGGVGITAALSLMQEVSYDKHSRHSGAPAVLLVWSCRQLSELQFLMPHVLATASEAGLDLQTHLHYTGATAGLAHTVADIRTVVDAPAACTTAASPDMTTPLCPVTAAASLAAQAMHKLAIHIAVFAAAAGALLLVRCLSSVWAPGALRWSTGAAGLAGVVLTACATLLAGSLVLWASLAAVSLRKGRSITKQQGDAARQPLLAAADDGAGSHVATKEAAAMPEPARFMLATTAQHGNDDQHGGEGLQLLVGQQPLPVHCGRPDLRTIITAWLAQQRQLPSGCCAGGAGQEAALDVGVYGMGPEPLLQAMQLLCADINAHEFGERAGCSMHLSFHRRTHQL